MRMSDWSSDVCSSDLSQPLPLHIPKSIRARTAEPSPRHDLHRYSQLHASFPIVKNETLEPRSQLRPVKLKLNLELNLTPSTTPSTSNALRLRQKKVNHISTNFAKAFADLVLIDRKSVV